MKLDGVRDKRAILFNCNHQTWQSVSLTGIVNWGKKQKIA